MATRVTTTNPLHPDRLTTHPGEQDRPSGRWSWLWLFRVSTCVIAGVAVAQQLAGRFVGPSMVVLAVLALGAAALSPRRPRTVAWVMGLICVLNVVLHAFMFAVLVEGIGMGLILTFTLTDLVATVLILISSAMLIRGSDGERSGLPRRLLALGSGVVLLATVLTFSLYFTRTSVEPDPGEKVLTNTGLEVAPAVLTLQADGAGAEFVFRNDDPLYPRSFDVDALDLHVVVAPRTGRRIVLPPGDHEFYDYVTMTDATAGRIVVRP